MCCLLYSTPRSIHSREIPTSQIDMPPNFNFDSGNAIFVDFQTATYHLNFNPVSKDVTAYSIIQFESTQSGMPLFDLRENAKSVRLDGKLVETREISSPDSVTSYIVALQTINPGRHTLEIVSPITQNIDFTKDGVYAAFWLNDLQDRSFLESYLPSNLEFDQYQMTFEIELNSMAQQTFFTNGEIKQINLHKFQITFPSYFTSSSPYFHTAPKAKLIETIFLYTQLDGSSFPITLYASANWASHYKERSTEQLQNIRKLILEHLKNLEVNFGTFPHPKLIIYLAAQLGGGMEYVGATTTSEEALAHEITHSYFGRGYLMPPNGNSGWIDEAITTWLEEGAQPVHDADSIRVNLAGRSPYLRMTPLESYFSGRDFIGHLHYLTQREGGFFSFLKNLKNSFYTLTSTENFIKKLSHFYNYDFTALFKEHVYSNNVNNIETETAKENSHHH